MTDNGILISINKQTVQNPKYFVYKNKKYQINFDLLKQNCTYFYRNQTKYFEVDDYVTKDQYIKDLLTAPNGRKAQIINFNINYVICWVSNKVLNVIL